MSGLLKTTHIIVVTITGKGLININPDNTFPGVIVKNIISI